MKILRLNNISDTVNEYLPEPAFAHLTQCEDPDAILVRSADMNAMELPASLLAIGRAGVGTNNIPIDRCSKAGIAVFNTPGANANAVKELVLCGMLLSGRDIIGGIAWAQSLRGQSDVQKRVEKGKNQFVGPELLGKRLGVVGLGAIGVMVANSAHALSMDVLGYDPFISVESAWGLSRSIERAASLAQILTRCDYVTIHVPLLKETRGMMNADAFAQMKEGAVLLNFSRDALVDETALLAALDSGRLRRYVTDFPTEAVLGHERVVAIPHLGASTPESEENCAAMAARELHDYLTHGTIANAVNLPACQMARSGATRVAVIHRNITNMVGQITSRLAGRGHNIANMVNRSRGEIAYTLLDLDEEPNGDAGRSLRNELGSIEGVLRVRVL